MLVLVIVLPELHFAHDVMETDGYGIEQIVILFISETFCDVVHVGTHS